MNSRVRRDFKSGFFLPLILVLITCPVCSPERGRESAEFRTAKALVLEWNRLALELERYTPGYRPPVSARMFAYVGSAAWEASLPGLKDGLSIASFCPGYTRSTKPPRSFYLPVSLNAAYAEILRQFFPTAPPHLLEKIQLVETTRADALRKETDAETYRQSVNFGKRAAQAVWRWSATDSIGHDACLYNFDRNYTPPSCAGCWQPDAEHPMPPLLPHWGNARVFVALPGSVALKPPVPFGEDPSSAFYAEALEVFTMSQPLSRERRWIAELWSDDVPGLTVSPTGRWVSIANQAVEKAMLPFPETLEMYLKLGFALSDAMVSCWTSKYRFNVERPKAYIARVIRGDWEPLHNAPSFPSYPSGHSALGAASAEILSSFLGQQFELTDRTHEGRQEFDGKPRTYPSFADMARENALSRISLGVHYRMDCEEGLRIGRLTGQKVLGIVLHKDEVAVEQ